MAAEKKSDNRLVAVLLCVAAAGCFIYAAVANNWLYNPRNKDHFEIGFGLRSNFECQPAIGDAARECRTLSHSELGAEWATQLERIKKEADGDPTNPQLQAFAQQAKQELRMRGVFPILGWITLVCISIAAVSLLICAGLALAKKRILWPMMPTTSAILGTAIGLITGCVFVAVKPGPPGYVGTGYGFYAFGGGVLAGIVGAILINKLLRPIDHDLLADSMDPEQY